eukprot:TRINITY_DN7_c1_g1_i1.p1 TRINITY_DN7_c1_g1~~TRINITY_DN7_c1_g1_i1.p1  ORF type:complete len:71 (+),score=5.90 TRINITY_DN7_c1_g1_i1:211-423(+)
MKLDSSVSKSSSPNVTRYGSSSISIPVAFSSLSLGLSFSLDSALSFDTVSFVFLLGGSLSSESELISSLV